MSALVQAALVVLGLVVSACTRVNAVLFGQPVSFPWLFVVAALIGLALAVALLVMVRLLVRDGLRLRPVVMNP